MYLMLKYTYIIKYNNVYAYQWEDELFSMETNAGCQYYFCGNKYEAIYLQKNILDIFFVPCYWIDKLLSLVIQTSVLLKNDLLFLQWR